MTAILALVRRDDLISDIDQLNLLDWTDGLALLDGTWLQGVASPDSTSIIETLTLMVRGTTHDNLAGAVRALDLKLTQVSRYSDPQERYGVWLRCKLVSETNTRQALLLSAARSAVPLWSGEIKNPVGGFYYLQQYTVALERMPYWESITNVSYNGVALTAINSLGGTWDYTTYGGSPGAVAGDVAARIAYGNLDAAAGIGPLTRAWVGFRTNRLGNRANLTPVWQLHFSVDAVRSDADTTKVVDATAQDGFKTTTTFATVATMLRRNTVRVSDFAAANPDDQRGTFMVLLRAKLSGAGSVNVRLADGYINNQNMALRQRVNIASTSYYLYELGTVQIPSPGRLLPGFGIQNYAMGLDAERISGAISLDCDCLILIPIGEGYLTTDQPSALAADGIGGAPGGNSHLVMEKPDGAKQGVYIATTPVSNLVVRYSKGLPISSGLLVVAAQRLASSVKTDTIRFDLEVYPRWATLRGNA